MVHILNKLFDQQNGMMIPKFVTSFLKISMFKYVYLSKHKDTRYKPNLSSC